MLKTKIKNLQSRLLMKNSGNEIFNTFIRKPFLSFSTWYLYPEFRKGNFLVNFINQNRILFLFVNIFFLWTISLFFFGRLSAFEKVKNLESKLTETTSALESSYKLINLKEITIDNLRIQTRSREYLQFVIKRDCQLRHYGALTKLPDDVFFTIIDEIEKYKIPYTIFFRLIDRESGFQFISNNQGSGAFGYCQVMPSTFKYASKKLKLKEHNQINNIKAGAWVLKQGFDKYKKEGFDVKSAWYRSLIDYSGGNVDLAAEEMKFYKEGLNKTKSILLDLGKDDGVGL